MLPTERRGRRASPVRSRTASQSRSVLAGRLRARRQRRPRRRLGGISIACRLTYRHDARRCIRTSMPPRAHLGARRRGDARARRRRRRRSCAAARSRARLPRRRSRLAGARGRSQGAAGDGQCRARGLDPATSWPATRWPRPPTTSWSKASSGAGSWCSSEVQTFLDDRARMLFLQGEPTERLPIRCDQTFKPLEIWWYGPPRRRPATCSISRGPGIRTGSGCRSTPSACSTAARWSRGSKRWRRSPAARAVSSGSTSGCASRPRWSIARPASTVSSATTRTAPPTI